MRCGVGFCEHEAGSCVDALALHAGLPSAKTCDAPDERGSTM